MRILLLSNGPGELYTWVKPLLLVLANHMKKNDDSTDLQLAIGFVPCQFASGNEVEMARAFVSEMFGEAKNLPVFSSQDVMKTITLGTSLGDFGAARALLSSPNKFDKEVDKHIGKGIDKGIVLSLGGSAQLAAQLAQRLGWAWDRYHFEPVWLPSLRFLYVSDEASRQKAQRLGAPLEQVHVVGNLVADAVANAKDDSGDGLPKPAKDAPYVLLMAGSRNAFTRYVLPMMLAVADDIAVQQPQAVFVYPLSRLVAAETIAEALAEGDGGLLGGTTGQRNMLPAGGEVIVTRAGTEIHIVPEASRYACMQRADVAVTIPGTNTLELGMAHLPTVVAFPLNKPEAVPLEGFAHWLGLVPVVGAWLKGWAVRRVAPFLPAALPNKIAGEKLFVELKGILQASDVSAVVLELLADAKRREEIATKLEQTMPRAGAAERLLEILLTHPTEKYQTK